jgi:hypothetical protein
LENRTFTARDFGELPNGICRIAAPLTHELALTLPRWRECLRPIAARLAQTFRESLVNKGVLGHHRGSRTSRQSEGSLTLGLALLYDDEMEISIRVGSGIAGGYYKIEAQPRRRFSQTWI